jgi:hypothetical protein
MTRPLIHDVCVGVHRLCTRPLASTGGGGELPRSELWRCLWVSWISKSKSLGHGPECAYLKVHLAVGFHNYGGVSCVLSLLQQAHYLRPQSLGQRWFYMCVLEGSEA